MDILFTQTNTALACIFVVLALLYFLSRKISQQSKDTRVASPPQAGGAWPIIGNLHLLGGSNNLPHKTLGAMADKYGPIFTMWLGEHRTLVVSSWEVAKEIFTTHDVIVSSRPKFIAGEHLGYNGAMFGFAPYGPYWREIRKTAANELLSIRRLHLMKHIQVSETEASIREIYELCSKSKELNRPAVVEMKQWFSDLTLNVVMRMVAGKRYFGIVAGEIEEAQRCQKVMREFFHLMGIFLVGDSVPFMRWFDIGGNEKAMRQTSKEMDNILGIWLDEHKKRKKTEAEITADDFMDVMLSVTERTDFAGFHSDTIIKATCMLLIAGASDTTSVMLTWTLSLLLNNRDSLKKVQEELDVKVGKERTVNESDINNLVYLKAVIKETLRLYPAGPLGGVREFTEDCTVAGYYVPKGTRLMLNLWKLQRDQQIWSEPSEFKPERFLNTHKDVEVKGQHFELIPFGAGRRLCPGITFGLQMLHLVLATLLHSFEISTPSNLAVDMTESAGLTNIKATPLQVILVPRFSSNVD